MRLLLIRHAIAEPLGGQLVRDEDRPLTQEGERRFVEVARCVAGIVPRPCAILSSPLLRARQTADIAAEAWGDIKPSVSPALVDGNWAEICRALTDVQDDDTVVLVGHENWISALTARLLGSKSSSAFAYRKGGVALIEVDRLASGRGILLWFIPPRVFRRV